MKIRRKGGAEVLRRNRPEAFSDLEYLTFPLFEKLPGVRHLISTRLGGVSRGYLGSMNLSYTRGDEERNVDENFCRIGALLGRGREDFVFTDQTHTANVRRVTEKDRGKGSVRERDYRDVDGLVTDERGLVLSAFFADCVPLLFADPVKKVIGLSHSGWRGTVEKIGKRTVETMIREYGSRPEDIRAAIGPSICQDCYEVSEDVAEAFRQAFGFLLPPAAEALIRPQGEGKYRLNLWEANRRLLLDAGIRGEHLAVTDLCTCCNPEYLFSHRASRGNRGNLGVFLMLS